MDGASKWSFTVLLGILFGPLRRMSHVLFVRCHARVRFSGRRFAGIVVRGALFLLIATCLGPQLFGQRASNLHTRWFLVAGDTLQLDTLSVVPGSVHVHAFGVPVGPGLFTVDPFHGILIWTTRPVVDSVLIRYRTMPLLLGGVRRHKDPDRMMAIDADRPDPFRYTPPREAGDLMGTQGLNRSGSISRGVLFGNNQDLSVNSTLNLELSGRISDRISVLASITDNNIPIQAGGNTLELQDFDQVFIKLFEEDPARAGNLWELTAGDLVLRSQPSHFLTYLKKNKGLSYDTRYGGSDGLAGNAGATIAISKGKFARNVVQGVEGVQGPYRMRGNEGEQFIVILSGTERVFIDGLQLVRGQENDYVIDYNTAEITFTARRLITKDRRIVVEFQYSDKNYARSMVRLDNATDLGRSTFRFNLYSEQDHKNQPLQQQLSDEERLVLQDAGDDPLQAIVPGVDSTAFSVDEVLYWLTDSLGYSPVYVYNTSPDSATFRITFTEVGSGNGDYVQQEFTPNGRVFRWVAPDTVNGIVVKRGDHAPVRVLVAPRSQQLMTFGLDHRFSELSKATMEIAFSSFDANTFSSKDDGNDNALGLLLGGEHAIRISEKDTSRQLVIGADVESRAREFRVVERYRAVEFERNWNARDIPLDGDQILAGTRVGVRGRNLGQAFYGLNTFQVEDRYEGWKQDLVADLRMGRLELNGTASWLNSTVPRQSEFLRHKARIKRRFRHLSIGYQDDHELNRFSADTTEGLRSGSYQFYDWETFVQSPDSFQNKWRLSGGQRYEKAIRDGSLVPSTRATAFGLNLDLARDPRNRLNTSFTYRQLSILDSIATAQKPEDTYLARVEYNMTAWKGVAVLNSFYELGSGLEQRREYIYLEVPAGQGLYVWIDYNDNGIKELNEFELANFEYEANYLRVFVPSDDYIRAFSNQFSASLDLRPAVVLAEKEGLRGFIGKLSDVASYRVDRRSNAADALEAVDPFRSSSNDSSLTSYSASARNTVYYDRTSRSWSVDHTFQNDLGRTLLLNGFESRSRRFNTGRVRWNTTPQWTADVEAERGRITNASDLLSGRTYAVDQQGLRPRVTWQPNTSLRAVLYFKYTEKTNAKEFGGQRAETQDLGAEIRYNTAGKGSILGTVNILDIDYDGEVNSPLGNEMLTGLKPGTNVTWSISVQRNLSNNLQVDLTYNGRSSEGVPVVHVGGAQVRAFF